jgi:flagellar biosynthesis/type III secretory pathway protein FliH
MATLALFDLARFALAVEGDVIPAAAWRDLGESVRLLDEARTLQRDTERIVAERLERAHSDGIEAGRRMFLAAIVSLEQRVAAMRQDESERALTLALAIVRHIAPRLGKRKLVAELARQAVQAAQAEQELVIRVHPRHVDAVRAAIQEALPAGRSAIASVSGQDSLDEFDCVVDTDLGRVYAGLEQQLGNLEQALRRASK